MTASSKTPPKETILLAAFFRALRPKQWTKNALLFAGLLFTLDEKHPAADYGRALLAFALFCALSGATYLINDIADREADKNHPRKKLRPIASGMLSVRTAQVAAAILLIFALCAGYAFLGGAFALLAGLYVALTLSYSFYLKHIAVVDVMVLAAGFVLRAGAGAAAIHVEPSVWLLLCTGLLALFLALNKRKAEIVHLGIDGDKSLMTRRVLADYSLTLLDQMITITASSCLIAYALYTFSSKTGQARHGLMATLPFVLYGLFRYLFLTQKGKGEAPDAVLLEDIPLRINLILWTLTVVFVMLWR